MFKQRTVTKELESIPFDEAFRLCEAAISLELSTQKAALEQSYQAKIEALEQEYTDTHEAPSEVSFGDQIEMPQLDIPGIRRKARNRSIIDEFIPAYRLDTITTDFVMPQIIRWLTRKFLSKPEIRDGKTMLNKIFDFDKEWDRGLYYFLMLDSRSCYIKSQYKGSGKAYCSLVPLIPYAFKLKFDIPYKAWSREDLHLVVNDSLCQAMLCEPPTLNREELLAIRDEGLTYKSGVNVGKSRNPQTTYKLYGVQHTMLGNMPELAQTMLTQIWCAHPSNRTKFMVLSPSDWDELPTPLVTDQIFIQEAKSANYNDLPW